MPKGHEVVAQVIAEQGIRTLFGLIGEANMRLADDFVRIQGGRYVAAPREDGVVLAAFGHAHVTGDVSVGTVTHGPGLTNTVTALTEAARNRTPIVILAGDTAANAKGTLQDIDHAAVIAPTGAGFEQIRTAEQLGQDIRRAFGRAVDERRPIVVSIPVDLQERDIDDPTPMQRSRQIRPQEPSADALDRALGIIASSRRPLLLAGRGAVLSGARTVLLDLASRIGAPVATTLKAKDMFRGDPYDLGLFGTLSSELTSSVAAQCDCIIAFGAGLNRYTTADGGLLRGRAVVQIDDDPTRLGREQHVDAAVLGDVGIVSQRMLEWLDGIDAHDGGLRIPSLAAAIADWDPRSEFEDQSRDGTVDLRTFIIELDRMLPHRRNVVTDVGRYVMAPLRFLHTDDPSAAVAPLGFGAVGHGIGTGIGVAVARSDAPTVVVVGDGGLMMSLAEFGTAVRNGLDLILVVLNDRSYAAEFHNFARLGMDPGLSMLDWSDLAPLGDALGGQGIRVTSLEDLPYLASAIADRDRPLLVEVLVDPSVRIGFYD
jgi:thiamine pyrophosphate-dependent acetolactate synthase large subunit-like protein